TIAALLLGLASASEAQTTITNRLISYPDFLATAKQVSAIRETHRLTEGKFLQAMAEPGVVLLDARSAANFKLRHLQGAVNLSLPDFTADTLAAVIPTKQTKVLIYCNNNFLGSPISLASKAPGASLNISSFVNLHTYGYTNVFELGPLLNVKTTKLTFAGDEVSR
ncbi:MAG: hypothetical protein RL616_1507, partial [Verrucomicrobiota bacterium]